MTDEIDEYIVEQLREQDGKKFCNIVTDDLGLETEEEKAELEAKSGEAKGRPRLREGDPRRARRRRPPHQ